MVGEGFVEKFHAVDVVVAESVDDDENYLRDSGGGLVKIKVWVFGLRYAWLIFLVVMNYGLS